MVELFTQTSDETRRSQFIHLLVSAITEPNGPLIGILTLRADFYDRPMFYPELGKLLETNGRSVLPMSLADLYDVIQKPASLPDVRLTFDEGLVSELVFEVRDQTGGLPLLQFTLDQLFERRDGQRLTNVAYEAIGGLRGALAKHAEATYDSLPCDDHRRLARALFLWLVEPGSTDQDTTRRRITLSELQLSDTASSEQIQQMAVRIVHVGIGRRRAACLAVELRRVRVAPAVDHLGRQACEQRLRSLAPVKHLKLPPSLCADQNIFHGLVESNTRMRIN